MEKAKRAGRRKSKKNLKAAPNMMLSESQYRTVTSKLDSALGGSERIAKLNYADVSDREATKRCANPTDKHRWVSLSTTRIRWPLTGGPIRGRP